MSTCKRNIVNKTMTRITGYDYIRTTKIGGVKNVRGCTHLSSCMMCTYLFRSGYHYVYVPFLRMSYPRRSIITTINTFVTCIYYVWFNEMI